MAYKHLVHCGGSAIHRQGTVPVAHQAGDLREFAIRDRQRRHQARYPAREWVDSWSMCIRATVPGSTRSRASIISTILCALSPTQ